MADSAIPALHCLYMAHAEKFSQWVELVADTPGLSYAEQARRIGVGESTIRRWGKGIVPANAPKAALIKVHGKASQVRDQRKAKAELTRSEAEDAIERLIHVDPDQLFGELEGQFVPDALSLPLEAVKQLREAMQLIVDMAVELKEKGMGSRYTAVDIFRARLQWSRDAVPIFKTLVELGLPNSMATRALKWAEDPGMSKAEADISVMLDAALNTNSGGTTNGTEREAAQGDGADG